MHPAVWWSNATFFLSIHVAAAFGVWLFPISSVPRATLALCFVLFQAGEMAITVGYHRLYSHRAFRATFAVRVLVALVGASAMQGSIKWWTLRHRLHHRFTDDPVHDPYAATRGFFWSHMGWIFFKSRYERIELIDKRDLDNDPVVRFQHTYYVPLALLLGLMLPPAVGYLWGDAYGAFVWGALVPRVLIWHCTFLVNSLAHWDGLQPYSDENTSKSNFILAVLTCGEGNHNFHAFPHDYRSGPSLFDWDPSKWTILLLHAIGLVSSLKRARPDDVNEALTYMSHKKAHDETHLGHNTTSDAEAESDDEWSGEVWTWLEAEEYVHALAAVSRCVLVIDGYVINVTGYLGEHPGGAGLLRKYSMRTQANMDRNTVALASEDYWHRAGWAFHGGLNVHTRAAKKRMRELRVAKLSQPCKG